MAKTILRAGDEIDILSGEEFNASHEKLIEAIRKQSKRPSVRMLDQAQEEASAAGLAVIETKGPPTSRAWDIRRITVASESALRLPVIVTGVFHYINTESPANFLDVTTQIPDVSVWEDGQLLLRPGQTILTVVVGAPADETIVISIYGIDYSLSNIQVD